MVQEVREGEGEVRHCSKWVEIRRQADWRRDACQSGHASRLGLPVTPPTPMQMAAGHDWMEAATPEGAAVGLACKCGGFVTLQL